MYAPSDEANPYRSRPVVDSAVECTLDIPPEPVDPDREHLRTLPVSLSEFGFLSAGPLNADPVEYTSYTWWQGRYRPILPQPEYEDEEGFRPPTPDSHLQPYRVELAQTVRQAGLAAGLDSLGDYTGDESVFKLRDVLYSLGLSAQGTPRVLLRRLVKFKVGGNYGHLTDPAGVNIRADNIYWRDFKPETHRLSAVFELCYGLGVLNSVDREVLDKNIRTFKNEVIFIGHSPPVFDPITGLANVE